MPELDASALITSIIGGVGGAAAAILVALYFVLRYLDARDRRNRESFESLATIYAGMIRDIVASHERNIERLLLSPRVRGRHRRR